YRDALEQYKAAGFDAKRIDADTKGLDLAAADNLEELVKLMKDESDAAGTRARAEATRGLAVSLAGIGAAALAARLACSWLIMKMVSKPLERAVTVVDRVAAGDLTVQVHAKSDDEIGKLLKGLMHMRDGLAQAVAVIRRSAEGVGVASKQIAAGHA